MSEQSSGGIRQSLDIAQASGLNQIGSEKTSQLEFVKSESQLAALQARALESALQAWRMKE